MDPDGKRLWPVAGRRVPKEWIAAITPLTIGASVGSCGTAAFRSQRVITSDIAADPLWSDYRDLALSNGSIIRRCSKKSLAPAFGKVLA
jgi:hypothetical protein